MRVSCFRGCQGINSHDDQPGTRKGCPYKTGFVYQLGTRKGCPYREPVCVGIPLAGILVVRVSGRIFYRTFKLTKFDPDKNHRRSIRLKNYNYTGNGAYFVTFCTFDRGCYFEEYPQLCEIVERFWLNISVRYENLWLDEYVIMPNHFHGIIVIDKGSPGLAPISTPALGSIIGSFKSLCVNEWLKAIKNQNINAKGKFWQENYYEHIIRSEGELGRIREYIRNNPVQWEFDRENRMNSERIGAMPEKWMV